MTENQKQTVLDFFEEYPDLAEEYAEQENPDGILNLYNEHINLVFPDVLIALENSLGNVWAQDIYEIAREWNDDRLYQEGDTLVLEFFDKYPYIAEEYLGGSDPYYKYRYNSELGDEINEALGNYTLTRSKELAEEWSIYTREENTIPANAYGQYEKFYDAVHTLTEPIFETEEEEDDDPRFAKWDTKYTTGQI